MITQVYSEHSHNFSYFVNVIFSRNFHEKIEFHKKHQPFWALQSKRGKSLRFLSNSCARHDHKFLWFKIRNFPDFFTLKQFWTNTDQHHVSDLNVEETVDFYLMVAHGMAMNSNKVQILNLNFLKNFIKKYSTKTRNFYKIVFLWILIKIDRYKVLARVLDFYLTVALGII